MHRCRTYAAFWTMPRPGRKKIFQKEQLVMDKKSSLSINATLQHNLSTNIEEIVKL